MRSHSLFAGALASACISVQAAGLPEAPPQRMGVNPRTLQRIDDAIRKTIRDGKMPGAVCIIGHKGTIVYRKAFGYSSLQPVKRVMTVDTVFDMASLTKVTATAPSIMTLVEDGLIGLQTDMATLWPAYAQDGKGDITIQQLLCHSAGLPPGHGFFAKYAEANKGKHVGDKDWVDLAPKVWGDLAAAKLSYSPDSRCVYSDDGFVTLGEIVHRVTGKPLDVYARERIFKPLKMNDTTFRPGAALRKRSAVTELRWGTWLQGEVHDPNSWTLNGIAGHAGLFSTADDLARYAQMYLNGGELDGVRVLSPATVRAMTNPASAIGLPIRGLGWDIDSGYTKRGDLFGPQSFGHTGWTGTSLWVDKPSRTFVVLLSNRNHVKDGNVSPLVWKVSTLVAAAIDDLPADKRTADFAPPRRDKTEDVVHLPPARPTYAIVRTGIDVLESTRFAALMGRKIGLVTNPSGIDRSRRLTADILFDESKKGTFDLVAFFGPEHGIRADVEAAIPDSRDAVTGLPVYSLYDYPRGIYKPTPEMMKGIDTLVYDVQDIGVRYYTYITTLAKCMEACRENGAKMIVLDRPNPVNGVVVDGPKLDMALRNFAGYEPLPVRHGLTVGELAQLFKGEYGIDCQLEVIPCQGWNRAMWFDQTGLPWVNPSPNIRDLNEAALYPFTGLLEAANVSVGRGTDRPFELWAAPWINDVALAEELNRRNLPGVSFTPIHISPKAGPYKGEDCGGVEVQITDREAIQGARSAVEALDVMRRLFGENKADVAGTRSMFGTQTVTDGILSGKPVADIAAAWQKDVDDFKTLRRKYLIYP
ncbi:MAG TPA: exo-beta-N-acetylmuramidase NamZ domain-containing protein [Armatimonadota bacterium]|jgi:uncharacterized protein YbbC (DUF1343 family)/CubicO group peptidase (beta-lactamase class C family)